MIDDMVLHLLGPMQRRFAATAWMALTEEDFAVARKEGVEVEGEEDKTEAVSRITLSQTQAFSANLFKASVLRHMCLSLCKGF